MRRPWTSARGRTLAREGWLVAVAGDGVWGYGDCAPLPQAGTESLGAAWPILDDWRSRLLGLPLHRALGSLNVLADATPAAACALECALLDLEGRLRGLALRRLLDPEAGDSVPVNGALGPLPEVAPADLERAAAAGVRVLKLKLGVADPRWEIDRLADLSKALPAGLRLRLDANGAWDRAVATRMVAALAGLPVECIEEPLASPDPGALAALQGVAGFALALDESLARGAFDLDPARFPVRRAVLKPAAQGGLRRTLGLARALQGAGLQVVVTSLVESAAGLWASAQLAAAVASPIPQGLATACWLAQDLGPPPLPEGGTLRLPDRPGSGFEPDRLGLHNP